MESIGVGTKVVECWVLDALGSGVAEAAMKAGPSVHIHTLSRAAKRQACEYVRDKAHNHTPLPKENKVAKTTTASCFGDSFCVDS